MCRPDFAFARSFGNSELRLRVGSVALVPSRPTVTAAVFRISTSGVSHRPGAQTARLQTVSLHASGIARAFASSLCGFYTPDGYSFSLRTSLSLSLFSRSQLIINFGPSLFCSDLAILGFSSHHCTVNQATCIRENASARQYVRGTGTAALVRLLYM